MKGVKCICLLQWICRDYEQAVQAGRVIGNKVMANRCEMIEQLDRTGCKCLVPLTHPVKGHEGKRME